MVISNYSNFNLASVDTSNYPKHELLVGNNLLMEDIGLPHMRIWETKTIYDHWRKKIIVPDSDDQFWLWNPIKQLTHKISASKLTGFFFKAPWRTDDVARELDFIDCPHYWITPSGCVFAEKKMDWLKQKITKYGYCTVSLTNTIGDMCDYFVHRLVAMAYIPNLINASQVNHKDGNKTNNHISNLEWITAIDNKKHAAEVLHRWGKLEETTVRNICNDIVHGISNSNIANKYNVPLPVVRGIKDRRTYKYITIDYEW